MSKFKFGPLQKKWLKALESGEYSQTKGVLCKKNAENDYSFCCLGLLLDQVLGHQECSEEVDFNDNSVKITVMDYKDNGKYFITTDIENKIGMIHGVADDLAQLNDDGKKFKTIAKEIRKNPEKYFEESK